MAETKLKDILALLRSQLSWTLGDQLEKVVLFGSRARGEERLDSDIDVLIVMRGEFDYGDLIRRTSHIVSALSLQYDVVISRAFISKDRFEREESPFVRNVRREGVPV